MNEQARMMMLEIIGIDATEKLDKYIRSNNILSWDIAYGGIIQAEANIDEND